MTRGEGTVVTVEELVDAHAADVRRYLYRRLVGAPDPASTADDLTADVLVIAWRRRDDVPEGAELPWLYAVARRVLANYRRRPQDVLVADLGDLDAVDEADPGTIVTEDAVLAQAWRSLSPRDREVLRLVAWEGLSGAQLAAALGIGEGGAAAALSRARSRFEESLAQVQGTATS
jgi:RNA polymerase sigma-70 factor (ECF subfamily)